MDAKDHELERDDPLGGAFGGARAVRAGDFVFTSAMGGVTGLDDDIPRFAETFEDQLRVVGERLNRCLGRFGCTAADIVDATVWVHPSVDVEPGRLLDRLQTDVFDGHAPAVSIARAASMYDEAFVRVKVMAYKPR
jgi:enamine deaminase RidA (YjgF/YER057c/UK114 family)